MIAKLTGKLILKKPSRIIIETGGVGFEIFISSRTYEKLPGEQNVATLNIHMHVREDEIRLIGFYSEDEKEFFTKLLQVSGISIKIALSSLSIYSVSELKNIITKKEVDFLRRIPGIGKKLAERMILELKDKIKEEGYEDISMALEENEKLVEIKQALSALGYNNTEINNALKKVDLSIIYDKKIEEILKLLLREI